MDLFGGQGRHPFDDVDGSAASAFADLFGGGRRDRQGSGFQVIDLGELLDRLRRGQ